MPGVAIETAAGDAPRARVLAALDLLLAVAVIDALGELERDPRLGHQLRGRLTGLRSYRVGVYRIVNELRDDKTPPRACGPRPRRSIS